MAGITGIPAFVPLCSRGLVGLSARAAHVPRPINGFIQSVIVQVVGVATLFVKWALSELQVECGSLLPGAQRLGAPVRGGPVDRGGVRGTPVEPGGRVAALAG
ncbi:hypothetical protein Sme01_16310 [Sphaerisporangium melleum]|uniref:Uncharacterized protein n=1 Tax=Sphaerisporangium melleum TaxID=321316 RepID=A0A917RNE9_9ACTN|nr:hypothetical protein GCM10007964_66290 [Sphaerisporangium melleum]GII69155.1 hypothetical protein Sme01_16310 [Sphaerisporangium melleum]